MNYRSFYHLILVDALNKGRLIPSDLQNAILFPRLSYVAGAVEKTVNVSGLSYKYNLSEVNLRENVLANLNLIASTTTKDATKKVYDVLQPFLHYFPDNASWGSTTNTSFINLYKTTKTLISSTTYTLDLTLNQNMAGLFPEAMALYSEIALAKTNGTSANYEKEIENELNRIKEINNQAIAQLSSEREKFNSMKESLESAIDLARKENFSLISKTKEMNEYYLQELQKRDVVIDNLLNSGMGDLNSDPELTALLGSVPKYMRYYIMQTALTNPIILNSLQNGSALLTVAMRELIDGLYYYEHWYYQLAVDSAKVEQDLYVSVNPVGSSIDIKEVFNIDLKDFPSLPMPLSVNTLVTTFSRSEFILGKYIFPHQIDLAITAQSPQISKRQRSYCFYILRLAASSFFTGYGGSNIYNGRNPYIRSLDLILVKLKELVKATASIKQDLELVRINTEVSISDANKQRLAKVKEMSELENATKEAEIKWAEYQAKLDSIESEIASLSNTNIYLDKTLKDRQGLIEKLTSLIGL